MTEEELAKLCQIAASRAVRTFTTEARPELSAEDLRQEAALAALKVARNAKTERLSMTLLTRSARSAAVDLLSRSRRQKGDEMSEEPRGEDSSGLRRSELYEMLDGLTERQRDAIVRRYGMEGYEPHSFPQLEAALEVDDARSLIDEALDAMRRSAGDLDEEEQNDD